MSEDTNLIDNQKRKGNAEITYKHGPNFGIAPIILGVALMFMGIVMILSTMIVAMFIGVGVFLAGSMLSTSTSGVQVDFTNELYREYSTFLFVKMGKWKPLNYFPYISVMKANKSNRASDITGLNRTVTTKENLGIYLLNKTHRKKLLIKRTGMDMQDARQEAQQFADSTDKEVVRFNPKVVSRRRTGQ
ncbi:MAG: hypothetical protein ACQERC_00320 [Bacteroidota bacterium]